MSVLIAPSILAADFSALGAEVAAVTSAGADWIHVDVMDGQFVPNITIGMPVVAALRRHTKLPLDVHLMIAEPERFVDAFVAAGASTITVHAEACRDLARTIGRITQRGVQAGVALKPGTPLARIEPLAPHLDVLLIMSVHPGLTGQAFLPQSLRKVAGARALLERTGSRARIEVDGGVDLTNAGALVAAGASVLVAGAAVFYARDRQAAIGQLREAAEKP